jgi:hypothetical protein
MALLFDDTIQDEWRKQHIPHRIRAGLIGIRHMKAPWDIPLRLPLNVTNRSIANSVNEGRHSAIRWLIFFVGIMTKSGLASPTKYTDETTDVWIERFDGGKLFDHTSADAAKLAEMYKGCTKATGHPTHDGHPDIKEGPMSEAMGIIIEHLQKTMYDAQGYNLAHFTLRTDDSP